MVAAGVDDAKGEAKYTGLHALRHFYASWLINRKADGLRVAIEDGTGSARAFIGPHDLGCLRPLISTA
jgi:hypothetical protein